MATTKQCSNALNVCTGIESPTPGNTGLQAQCNATASTPNLRLPGVALEFSVGGTGITPLPKLEIKVKTLTGLLCDNIYDHLIFNVQENSSGQQYRHKLQAFLTEKQDKFYKKYTVCTGIESSSKCNSTDITPNTLGTTNT